MLPDQRPSRAGVAARFLREAVDFSPGLATLHHATGAPVWFCVLLLDADRQTDRQQPDQHTPAERPSPTLRLHLLRLAERRPAPEGHSSRRSGRTPRSRPVAWWLLWSAESNPRPERCAPGGQDSAP